MSTWAIGDVHGCFATLERLWARLDFDEERDRLWLVGDLVNRGPDSLAVLRWAKALSERLGERMVAVLGNHDTHLLARHEGVSGPKPGDTLDPILAAADRDELVEWLARRPVIHRDRDALGGEHVLVHAGLLPQWTVDEALALARDVEGLLRDRDGRRHVLGKEASPERDALRVLVTVRACTDDGELCRGFSGPPAEAPPGCRPWFEIAGRRSAGVTMVFGHWAAMGLRIEPRVVALDSGVVWGGELTAIRLDDRAVVSQPVVEGELGRKSG